MRSLVALLVILGLVAAGRAAADIRVSVDRDPIRVDESFMLTYEYDGAAVEPDFSPLEEDFEILQSNRISSVQIENGVAASQLSWQLSLMPRRAGALIVPPVRFGARLSKPLRIQVLEPVAGGGDGSEEIFLEASVEPAAGYVQAQLLYTVKLFRSVSTANASLTDPELSGSDAVVRKLEQDKSYEAWRDGRRYSVFERRYAVFPQTSGDLQFEPVVFRGEVRDRGWRMRVRRAVSNPVNVAVAPRPDGAADPWLPARGVELADVWPDDPPVLRAGEAVTRTVTLVADGLTAAQLPPVVMNLPEDIKTYPDQPVLRDEEGPTGIMGFRQEKIALLPTRAGSYELPAIRLPWFDTASGEVRVAVIPARRIEVLPAAGTTAPVQPEPAAAPAAAGIAESAAAVEHDLVDPGLERRWRRVSLALASGWGLTLMACAWWYLRHRRAPAVASRAGGRGNDGGARSAAAVLAACRASDPAAARNALIAWGRAQFPESMPSSLLALATLCDSELSAAILGLNRVLYGSEPAAWRGDALAAAFRGGRRNAAMESGTDREAVLSPL